MQEIRLYEYDTIDSTNRLLLDMARDGEPCGSAVWAHRQSGGRGRLGRSFCSPEGGIYVSVLVPLNASGSSAITLTAMAGVAVRRTIKQVCGKDCGIKWVNDIIYKGKKVCGILAQACGDKAVIGIGVNYRTDISAFPPELQETAISLYRPEDNAPSDGLFVRTLVSSVYSLCTSGDENWLSEYKSSSTIVGNKVQIMQAGKVTGVGLAVSIDDSCALHIVDGFGKETVLSTGEVSIRIREEEEK